MTKPKSVKIQIPADLHEQLTQVLSEKRLTIEDAAILYLRSMVSGAERNRCMLLADRMAFGKYKGSTLENIIKAQPDYISWLLTNSKSFSIEIEAMELLNDMLVA